jgi:transposase
MPAPLSVDLRQRILAAYDAKEGSQRQLAERFKVSLSFIRDLRRQHRETGSVQPKRQYRRVFVLHPRDSDSSALGRSYRFDG